MYYNNSLPKKSWKYKVSKQIVLVEDEQDLRDNYTAMLENQGYQVTAFSSKKEAQIALQEQLPDLVILDIGLEDDIDGGFELCRQLRSQSEQLPIIFLTARDNDIDTISALRLGADDYLTKDISLQHLSARISAIFRRIEALSSTSTNTNQPNSNQAKSNQTGELSIDLERLEVFWQGNQLELTITEIWLLNALVAHPGHVKSREQLMQAANTLVDDNTITAQIRRIRNKFLESDKDFDCIESVYGAGYRWHC